MFPKDLRAWLSNINHFALAAEQIGEFLQLFASLYSIYYQNLITTFAILLDQYSLDQITQIELFYRFFKTTNYSIDILQMNIS